ncbi:MAG: hypothetical protein ABIQ16_02645 [Polyangiaceae bacterium]
MRISASATWILGVLAVSAGYACSSPVRSFGSEGGAAGKSAAGGPAGDAGASDRGNVGSPGGASGHGGGESMGGADGTTMGGTANAGGTAGGQSTAGGTATTGGTEPTGGDSSSAGGAGGTPPTGTGGSAGCSGAPAVCGNSATSGSETCDDGNTVTETCAYGQPSCTVCDSTCHSVAGAVSYCGDGKTNSGNETCDDGNTTTESCSYGSKSCTVCDSTCHSVAGAVSYCGDNVRQPAQEACDNGSANIINSNCSPTCTACDKVPGYEPLTWNDTVWTGGLEFSVTKATTLHQFKVYHDDSQYRIVLYKLAGADVAPDPSATPVWSLPTQAHQSSTFDTIDLNLSLAAGGIYLLTTVGHVMGVGVVNPATDFPVQSLAGIKVIKSFTVEDTFDLNQGVFRNTSWGPFTDLRSCLNGP